MKQRRYNVGKCDSRNAGGRRGRLCQGWLYRHSNGHGHTLLWLANCLYPWNGTYRQQHCLSDLHFPSQAEGQESHINHGGKIGTIESARKPWNATCPSKPLHHVINHLQTIIVALALLTQTSPWPTSGRRSLPLFSRAAMQLELWKRYTSLMSRFGRMQDQKVEEGSHAIYCSRVCFYLQSFSICGNDNPDVDANNGSGFIHKSKLNTNGSFSVGKTWRLPELRAVQVVNVCRFSDLCITAKYISNKPLAFNITLSRTYRWQTENPTEQSTFLEALVRLFRTVTAGAASLQLEGLSVPDSVPGMRSSQLERCLFDWFVELEGRHYKTTTSSRHLAQDHPEQILSICALGRLLKVTAIMTILNGSHLLRSRG